MIAIRCSLSTAFLDKRNLTDKPGAFAYSFKAATIPLEKLPAHAIGDGRAFALGTFRDNHRDGDKFIQSELLGADVDGCPFPVEQLLSDPLVSQAFLIYETPSSSPDNLRYRLLWRLPELITHRGAFEALLSGVVAYLRGLGCQVDSCTDAARFFYGSKGRWHTVAPDNVLTPDTLTLLTIEQGSADYLRETAADAPCKITISGNRAEQLAAATFRGKIADVRAATKGERDKTIFKKSAQLFSRALGGWPGFDELTIEREVFAAAVAIGYVGEHGERRARLTIAQGRKYAAPIPLELPSERPQPTPPAAPTPDPEPTRQEREPRRHAKGVPDSWRRATIRYLPGAAGPAYELIHDEIHGEVFTLTDLLAANERRGFHIPEPTLRRIVRLFVGVFLSKLPPIEHPNIDGKNDKKGYRPPDHYRLLTLSEQCVNLIERARLRIYERHHPAEKVEDGQPPVLAQPTPRMMQSAGFESPILAADELDSTYRPVYPPESRVARGKANAELKRLQRDLDDTHSTPLPGGWPLDSGANYKAAFSRALHEANPDAPRSRRQFAALVGASNGSVRSIVRRAGLRAEEQIQDFRITSADDVDQQVRRTAYQHKGYPLALVVHTADGREISHAYDRNQPETVQQVADRELSRGAQLSVRVQLPNKYKIVRTSPPEPAEPRKVENVRQENAERERPSAAQRRYYGPDYDPLWLYGQFKLGLQMVRGERYVWRDSRLIDTESGEYWDRPNVKVLYALIVGKEPSASLHLEVDLSDPLVLEAIRLGGVIGEVYEQSTESPRVFQSQGRI